MQCRACSPAQAQWCVHWCVHAAQNNSWRVVHLLAVGLGLSILSVLLIFLQHTHKHRNMPISILCMFEACPMCYVRQQHVKKHLVCCGDMWLYPSTDAAGHSTARNWPNACTTQQRWHQAGECTGLAEATRTSSTVHAACTALCTAARSALCTAACTALCSAACTASCTAAHLLLMAVIVFGVLVVVTDVMGLVPVLVPVVVLLKLCGVWDNSAETGGLSGQQRSQNGGVC